MSASLDQLLRSFNEMSRTAITVSEVMQAMCDHLNEMGRAHHQAIQEHIGSLPIREAFLYVREQTGYQWWELPALKLWIGSQIRLMP